METKKKIYLGCTVPMLAPDLQPVFFERIRDFKLKLEAFAEVIGFTDPHVTMPDQIVRHDAHCVENCDLLIVLEGHELIGIGYELGIAEMYKKPVLGLAQKNTHISVFFRGAHVRNSRYELFEYEHSYDEVLPKISEMLGKPPAEWTVPKQERKGIFF